MSLHETLQTLLNQAIRGRDVATRTVLRTLLGEAQNKSLRNQVPITDGLLVNLIKDFMANNVTILAARDKPELARENEILKSLLPQQMDDDQIRAAIVESNGSDIGQVMKYLTSTYSGQYNGSRAKTLALEYLASK